jgi:hypothetical protein
MTCSGRSPGLRVIIPVRLPRIFLKALFESFFEKSQWPVEKGLTAYSCGRSFGTGLPAIGNPHRIPFADRSGRHPKRRPLETSTGLLSRRRRRMGPTGPA